jgi:hypothetical protein
MGVLGGASVRPTERLCCGGASAVAERTRNKTALFFVRRGPCRRETARTRSRSAARRRRSRRNSTCRKKPGRVRCPVRGPRCGGASLGEEGRETAGGGDCTCSRSSRDPEHRTRLRAPPSFVAAASPSRRARRVAMSRCLTVEVRVGERDDEGSVCWSEGRGESGDPTTGRKTRLVRLRAALGCSDEGGRAGRGPCGRVAPRSNGVDAVTVASVRKMTSGSPGGGAAGDRGAVTLSG